MDSGVTWNDFHFMNTSFRQVAVIGQVPWIDPSAVTLTYHGSNDRNPARTIHAINGLSINYSVPFPLTYLFGAEIFAAYSSIFVFLLQVQRAKSTLDRTSPRRLPPVTKENHAIFVIRNKLVWFTT
jgi:gamma-tubulin complex component 5